MSGQFKENTTVCRVAARKIAVFNGLWLIAVLFLSCGGSAGTGGAGAGSGPVIFPPVVFMADNNNNGSVELYASFDDGTNIIQLSESMASGRDVVDFKVSPDGVWVAYVADQDTNNKFELYAVPVDKTVGDDVAKISGPMAGNGIKEAVPGGGEYFFAWAPDSSRIAYIADQETGGVFELFTSTPDGSDNFQVSGVLASGGGVQDFQWEPDSTLIAYVANQDSIGKFELYVSPSDGNSPNPTVSGIPMAGIGVKEFPVGSGRFAFAWAPNSSRLAYIADQDALGRFELFTSESDGAGNLKISELPGGFRDVVEFKWGPDSQLIAYTANQDLINAIDLYTAPPDRTASSQKNSSGLFADQAVIAFKWAPDSSRIAFLSDKGVTGFFRLYTVQPVNNFNIFISGSILQPSDVTEFEWSPVKWQSPVTGLESFLIAYLVVAQDVELYTTFPASDSSIQIGEIPVFGGDVFEFEWAPDSSRIAYRADYNFAGVIELFTSTPDNDATDPVSGTSVFGGDVGAFKWAPDSSGVGYIADQNTNNVDELFASQPNGSDNTNLSGQLVSGGDVARFEWVP